MTVQELLDQIARAVKAGKIVPTEDSVFVRDASVTAAAISAGSSGFIEAEDVLFIPDDNESGQPAGIYFDFEAFD